MPGPIDFLGGKIYRLVSSVEHMRRYRHRLRRGGVNKAAARKARDSWWGHEPRWYAGGTPPRMHNMVTPLIDGYSYFGALCDCLEQAQDYVFIAGWCLTPYVPLVRENRKATIDTRLLALLSRTARRVPVRILLWSGATAFLKPTSHDVEQVRDIIEKEGSGDIECRIDRSAHWTHCHHQKSVVVDGQVAFVGGMDLTTYSGDRWDVPAHPLRAGINWHDVQLRIEGEAVADVEANFRQRWEATKGKKSHDSARLPHRDPSINLTWHMPMQIVRTIPTRTYDFAPHGEYGILHWYVQAIRRAKRFIYIENQYLWSPHIMKALLAAIDAHHEGDFRIVVVLPAFAGDGRWDNNKHVGALRKADRERGIVSIFSLYTSGPNKGEKPFTYRAIYLHAKVAIIDDEWLAVGSANLNNRGLVLDGELDAVVHDSVLARRTRIALWAEHLGLPAQEIAEDDPLEVIDREWTRRAEENAAIIKEGDLPLMGALHRYMVGRKPSDLVLEDMQALTLEH